MEVLMIILPIAAYMITKIVLQMIHAGDNVSVEEKVRLIIEQENSEKHRIWYEKYGRQQEIDAKIRAEKMPAELKQIFLSVSAFKNQTE